MKKYLAILFSVCFTLPVNAQIYSTDFGTTTTGTPANPFNPTPLAKDPNVTTTGWSGGTQFTIGATGGGYSIGTNSGIGTYSIILTVATGYRIDISSISYKIGSSNNGPNRVDVNIGSNVFSGSNYVADGSFKSIISTGIANSLSGNVLITITTSGGSGNNRVSSLDDVAVVGSTVLPVKIQSFTANDKATSVDLKWNVGYESGILNYDVERSNDGTKFEKVNSVNAQNFATYSATDNSPVNGINHYRLKINETNGTFTYSDVVKIKMNGSKSITINSLYPNPANNFIKLSIRNDALTTGAISIMDISGKTVFTDNASLKQGLTEKTINVSNLKSGVYILKVSTSGESVFEKFIKQ